MSSELDTYIQDNIPWEDLPPHIRSSLGSSPSQWEAAVVEFSLKHQLRWKSHPVRHILKDERSYYDRLVTQGRENLMLFPYHLSVQVIQRLRITPFKYYHSMLYELMLTEKSYDTLPNFTAIDCLKLTDVGRNQYIDHMNNCRAKKFFRSRKIRECLPPHPAPLSHFEGWWIVHLGYVTEEDVKSTTSGEHKLIDLIIDQGATAACHLDPDTIASLYTKDLIYFEIPVLETDRISFPPLEGFVMNRVQGDAIETLLYKIFLSANDDTSVNELSTILQINPKTVRQAVSLFIRLGLARKKNTVLTEQDKTNLTTTQSESTDFLLIDVLPAKERADSACEEIEETVPIESRQKRLGFIYDSSLTAYLMMGNLSPGLKTHAVTMFEVGKLSEENIDSFLQELGQISFLSEGEAQRYFDHAHALFNTLTILRGSTADAAKPLPIDLLRAESIAQLDSEACQRLLSKNYHTLLTMAPLSSDAGIPCLPDGPPIMGPPSQSSSSVWFKLWLYQQMEHGPPSLLLTRGTRLRTLPPLFRPFSEVSCETWGHDPTALSTNTILQAVNDTLTHTPVFLQGYSTGSDTVTKYISFPITPEEQLALDTSIQAILQRLSQVLDLSVSCGFITLLKIGPSRLPNFFHTYNHNPWLTTSDTPELMDSSHLTKNPSIEETILAPKDSATPSVAIDPVTPPQIDLLLTTSPHTSLTSAQSMAENFLKELDELKIFDETSPYDCASDTVSIEQSDADSKSLEVPRVATPRRNEGTGLFSEWVLLDVSFGIPLFNIDLNKKVCHDLLRSNLLDPSKLTQNSAQSQRLATELQAFIQKCQSQQPTVQSWSLCSRSVVPTNHVPHPTRCVAFSDSNLTFFTP